MTSQEILASARLLSARRGVDPWRSLMMVLLERLRELGVPRDVQPSLEVAATYWAAETPDPLILADAKAGCWEYLRSFPPGLDVVESNGRRVRALLCVLEPEGDDEAASETAEWFAAMTSAPQQD